MVSGILIDGQQPPAYQFAESGGVVAAAAPATAAPVASVTAMAMPIGWSPGGMPVAPAVAGIADPTGAVPDGQAIEAAAGPAPEKAEGVVTVGAPPRCLVASPRATPGKLRWLVRIHCPRREEAQPPNARRLCGPCKLSESVSFCDALWSQSLAICLGPRSGSSPGFANKPRDTRVPYPRRRAHK